MDTTKSQTEDHEQGGINANTGKSSDDPSTPAPPKANCNETDTGIEKPGENDVLCGRGNFVNNHAGNEKFRKRCVLSMSSTSFYAVCPFLSFSTPCRFPHFNPVAREVSNSIRR